MDTDTSLAENGGANPDPGCRVEDASPHQVARAKLAGAESRLMAAEIECASASVVVARLQAELGRSARVA